MERVGVAWLLQLISTHASLDILVMGDWGGKDVAPFTTTPERSSASMMSKLAEQYGVDMVWGLGDNMYEEGVEHEFDTRFHQTFEKVFDSSSLSETPCMYFSLFWEISL